MKLLVFQHIDCEHPGSLRTYLKEDGVRWHAIELNNDMDIPDLDEYDALWVMGGPMDVWDVEEYPWLVEEKKAIRHWVRDLRKPYLGLCLGHQLLADAMGGTCGPARPPEIGILQVELTDEGRRDPVFGNLPPVQKCLQWHSVEVAQAPEGTTVLASSRDCRVQAMRVGHNAWSAQYHVELEADTIANWAAVPAYAQALENSLGPSALKNMEKEADDMMAEFASCSRQLYGNFMRAIRIQ